MQIVMNEFLKTNVPEIKREIDEELIEKLEELTNINHQNLIHQDYKTHNCS